MRGSIRVLAWTLGILLVIGGILHFFVFDVWTIPDDDPQANVGMLPTLEAGDLVLLTKKGEPEFGQLARCTHPTFEGRYVIGRVVGEPGDSVAFPDEVLSVNGKREVAPGACEHNPRRTVVNPATGTEVEMTCSREEFGGMTHEVLRAVDGKEAGRTWKVEPGHVFLLSDDAHLHQDSRDFGMVDPATCQHIVFRAWSAEGWGDGAHRLTFIW